MMKKTFILVLGLLLAAVLHFATLHAAEWYKGNLHGHSHWSDGNVLPEQAIGWYKDHGYHFVSLTDHNALQLDPNRWKEVSPELIEESRKKFGQDWVETKEENDKTLVRLKTVSELAQELDEPGKFLVIPGHEQNAGVAGVTLHANAINITESIPFPNDFPSIAAAASAWRKMSLENSTRNGLEGFWMINHPRWPYYDNCAEELIEASEIEFWENNMMAGPAKRQAMMPDDEKYWDIINAFRILSGNRPIYSVATDDVHNYLTLHGVGPGHGWVVVRSEKLDANSLFRAMKNGDFYSSCGVVLKDVRFDSMTKTLTVEVDPAEDAKYTIRFVGTKKGFDTNKEPFEIPQEGNLAARKGFTYSEQVGATFQTVEGTTASYKMAADDLYVRAIITSDKAPQYKNGNKPELETAWTQPYTQKPEGDGLFAVSYAEAIRLKKPPARKITIPDVGEYKVLKGDFHIHTIYSDGAVKPEARVQEAIDNGLDVIAITDHVESSGSRGLPKDNDRNMSYTIAKSEAEKQKLILVPATEISQTTVRGQLTRHFNALFITDANPILAVTGDWKAMIAVAAEQGAFIHWNHPAAPPADDPKKRQAFPFADEIEEARAKGHLHGIEVFNGIWYYSFAHDWCNERDLVVISNSDIHASEWNNYGHQNLRRPMTILLVKERDIESVREAFFAGRTIGWGGDIVFGREPWVEELFRACVEMKKTEAGLTLQNRSDIPCIIEVDGKMSELPPQGSLEIAMAKKLIVTNWLVGSRKPLEITP